MPENYTPQQLQEIGRKTVEARQKDAAKSKRRAMVLSALYKAWKEGKVSGPGIPTPEEARKA